MLLSGTMLVLAGQVHGQCPGIRVEHFAFSQQVGCSEVNVTADGFATNNYWDCPPLAPFGPYWIGYDGTGSFTFTFSPPVQGVKIDFNTVDNMVLLGAVEELMFEVNGVFYPVTAPGTAVCQQPAAVIQPSGTVTGPLNEHGSWRDMYIPGPISSLKIQNTVLEGDPHGTSVSVYICCYGCETDAGDLDSEPLFVCPSMTASVPPALNSFLDTDDILQYILYSNPDDITGSIVASNDIPEFSYNPATMTPGVTYYLAAIAGNDQNGHVDVTDPCLNVSNAVPVVWRSPPTVSFQLNGTCISPGDCNEVFISFTGTPPFQLEGQAVMGNNVLATFGGFYANFGGVYTLCIPANTPSGDLVIEGVSLTDAFCTCD